MTPTHREDDDVRGSLPPALPPVAPAAPPSVPDLPPPMSDAPGIDRQRVYVTNSLYRTWDDQFYPDGVRGWLAKVDVNGNGGITLDPAGFVEFDGMRPHQVHLEGGDASSDSYCFS